MFSHRESNSQDGSVASKEHRISGRRKALKVQNPRSDPTRNGWKAQRGGRRQESSNSEDAKCEAWKPREYGPFELVIAVGKKNPMRGTTLVSNESLKLFATWRQFLVAP